MSPLDIRVEKSKGTRTATVRCKGDIDAHTFDQLDETFFDLLDEGMPNIIADLKLVTYISSAGIGVLIGAKSEAEGHGGDLVLMNVARDVEEVFKVMGFDSMFALVKSEEEALKAFSASSRG